jgi:hypothetical protein
MLPPASLATCSGALAPPERDAVEANSARTGGSRDRRDGNMVWNGEQQHRSSSASIFAVQNSR